MIPVTNLRAGTFFTDGRDIFQVLSYEHSKLGRGTANIKLKTKNLKTGTVTEKSFISGAKVEEANSDKRDLQYLYQTQNTKRKTQSYIFMDPNSFEQMEFFGENIGEQGVFLKEGMMVKILFWQGEPLGLELPIKMEFEVSETEPGYRGNSATNIFKDAILENGLKVRVPLFVKTGDKVLVDTRTGEYVERINR